MTNRINREMVLLCAENALSMGLLDFGMAWLELAREIRLGTAEAAPVVALPPDHNPDKVFAEATSAAHKLGRESAEAADAYWATSLAESRAHWRRQWEAGDAARKQRDADKAPVVAPEVPPPKTLAEAANEALGVFEASKMTGSMADQCQAWECYAAAASEEAKARRKQRDDERAPADTLARSTASAAVEAWGVYEDSLGTGSSDEQKRAWGAYVAASWAATRALRECQKEGGGAARKRTDADKAYVEATRDAHKLAREAADSVHPHGASPAVYNHAYNHAYDEAMVAADAAHKAALDQGAGK